MDKQTVEIEFDKLSDKLKNTDYYKKMELATNKEIVELAVLVDVLVIQLNQLLKKFPSFNHSISTELENDLITDTKTKKKGHGNILLPNKEALRVPRNRIKC